MFFLKIVKLLVARGKGIKFNVWYFEEEQQNIEQYGAHQSFNLLKNDKAVASYSLFIQIINESCLRKSNMCGSEANASHFLIQGTMSHAPPIPLSNFI